MSNYEDSQLATFLPVSAETNLKRGTVAASAHPGPCFVPGMRRALIHILTLPKWVCHKQGFTRKGCRDKRYPHVAANLNGAGHPPPLKFEGPLFEQHQNCRIAPTKPPNCPTRCGLFEEHPGHSVV